MNLKTVYGITENGNNPWHQMLLKAELNYFDDFLYEKENLELPWYNIENK